MKHHLRHHNRRVMLQLLQHRTDQKCQFLKLTCKPVKPQNHLVLTRILELA